MNPIYKFELTAGATTQRAYPIYKDDLAKDFEQESGQAFFRAKLSGNLTFESDDYTFIVSKAFDTQFGLEIFISYNAGQTWTSYWRGTFWKTDCEFDGDEQTVKVKPTVLDQYNDVLAGLDKEYNLIELAPQITQIKADKRPMVQVYVPGTTVIGCFLSGMWWEQECNAVNDESALVDTYHFALNKKQRILDITQTGGPALPDIAMGEPLGYQLFDITKGGYRFRAYYDETTDPDGPFWAWEIVRVSDNIRMWFYKTYATLPAMPYSVTLSAVEGTEATGTVDLYVHDISVYARYVTDKLTAFGVETYPIPANDLVLNNRNYSRITGYEFPTSIRFEVDLLVNYPTQWGLYQPGVYYENPANVLSYGLDLAFPIARNVWTKISLWFIPHQWDYLSEQGWRQEFTLRDTFPIYSVISVILAQIAPNITHYGTTAYSQFLYGTAPIGSINQRLFITPKSNVISSGYDQPAQQAPITLKNVLDMLRDCFRCYWFIDDQNRFRIEHIQYFRNGGSYSGTPVVGVDLTAQTVTRNGKAWAFARDQYKFDKPEMAARYQFGWMDDVTQPFMGYPIEIVSKYVNPDNIEQIDISKFTSDIDYILLNPEDVSKDGFVLLSAVLSNGTYKLPYIVYYIGTTRQEIQNGYVAFRTLQQYYAYDMPARYYMINGQQLTAQGIKRLKTQSINFPLLTDPNTLQLVKTNLGNGNIEKLSVNLSSRNANATLKYDTE